MGKKYAKVQSGDEAAVIIRLIHVFSLAGSYRQALYWRREKPSSSALLSPEQSEKEMILKKTSRIVMMK